MAVHRSPPGPARHADAPCGHRGCTAEVRDVWPTAPNLVTAIRSALTVVLVGMALHRPDQPWWLAGALASYWLGDLADGALARLTRSETRTGAVLDILADRLSVTLIVTVYLGTHPAAFVPAAVFLVEFVLVDAYLSLAFLNWPLLSPNYFHLVDRLIFRWNWSRPAKATNTAAVIACWVLTGSAPLTTLLATAVLGVKVASAVRMARLPVPLDRSGCAAAEAGSGG